MQFAVRLLSPPRVADNWGMPSVHQGLPATGAIVLNLLFDKY